VPEQRTLIAGFGNVLRGDDGFGVEVAKRIAAEYRGNASVEVVEVGTGGIRLVQALLDGYDRLIVVDAARRARAPGAISVLEVDGVPAVDAVDMHTAVPAQALSLAAACGVLPRHVFIVACEPEEVDELSLELSPAVLRAVESAMAHVRALIAASPVGAQADGKPSGPPLQPGI
jgi:hydrogenase maturation protease